MGIKSALTISGLMSLAGSSSATFQTVAQSNQVPTSYEAVSKTRGVNAR